MVISYFIVELRNRELFALRCPLLCELCRWEYFDYVRKYRL